MKLDQVIQVYGGLADFARCDIPAALGFKVGVMLAKLEPLSANFDKQTAILRHKYGLDQPEATLRGIGGEDAPKLRAMDPAGFQTEYQKMMAMDVKIVIEPFELHEFENLRTSDGKLIPGIGTIAAKLSPIIKE